MEPTHIHNEFSDNTPLIFTLNEIIYDNYGFPIDYKLLEVNSAFEEKLELKKENIIGKLISDWLLKTENSRISWLSRLNKLAYYGDKKEFEEILEYKDRWYLVTAYTPKDGHLVIMLHDAKRYKSMRNILDEAQVKFQASLKKSQALTQSIFDNSPSSIVIYNVKNNGEYSSDYVIQDVSPAALITENWKKEDVIGKPINAIRPGVDEFGIVKIFKKVWKTGEPTHYPANVYLEDNECRWFDNIIFKLPTNEIVAIYNDITEMKKAEQELFTEKEKLKVTLYSIGDGVIATDKEGIIEIINPIAEKLTGWKFDEAYGKPLSTVFDIYNETTNEPSPNPVELVLKHGNIIGLANHTILKTKSGEIINIADSAAPIKNQKGEILGVILVFRDVAKEKKWSVK